MRSFVSFRSLAELPLGIGLALCFCVSASSAQVSPAEILSPDLKALEETYFPQLKSINQEIAKTKFPFSFYLSRYVKLSTDRVRYRPGEDVTLRVEIWNESDQDLFVFKNKRS
jgi:hypothetical protein